MTATNGGGGGGGNQNQNDHLIDVRGRRGQAALALTVWSTGSTPENCGLKLAIIKRSAVVLLLVLVPRLVTCTTHQHQLIKSINFNQRLARSRTEQNRREEERRTCDLSRQFGWCVAQNHGTELNCSAKTARNRCCVSVSLWCRDMSPVSFWWWVLFQEKAKLPPELALSPTATAVARIAQDQSKRLSTTFLHFWTMNELNVAH